MASNDIPLADFIKRQSGHIIIPMPKGHSLIQTLAKNLNIMLQKSRHTRYIGGRINEVGGSLESEIKSFIDASGLGTCETKPRAGYPDLSVNMASGNHVYIEVKATTSKPSENSSLRAFYISSAKHVQEDAHHILIHFFLNKVASAGTRSEFEFSSWAIRDLHDLTIRLKKEYNANMNDFKRLPVLAASP